MEIIDQDSRLRLGFSHLHIHWSLQLLTFHNLTKADTACQSLLSFSFGGKYHFKSANCLWFPVLTWKSRRVLSFWSVLGQKIHNRLHSCLENLHSFDDRLIVSLTLTKEPMGCYGKWQCASFKWKQSWRKALRSIVGSCQPCYVPTFAQECFIIDGRCSFTRGPRIRRHLNLNIAWNCS